MLGDYAEARAGGGSSEVSLPENSKTYLEKIAILVQYLYLYAGGRTSHLRLYLLEGHVAYLSELAMTWWSKIVVDADMYSCRCRQL